MYPEFVQLDRSWESLLSLEVAIKKLPKIWLCAECLQQKDAHPNNTLLGRDGLVLHSIENNQGHELVTPIGVNNERPKPLIALQSLPK